MSLTLLALSLALPSMSDGFPPSVSALANLPNVFQQRVYSPTPVPTFEKSRGQLPEPVVDDHRDWEDLYWKAWELAFQHLMQPRPQSGFVSNFIDPAFNGNTFQWDSCFMVMYAHYAEPEFHAIGTLDNFYAKQHSDGYICREIVRETGEDFLFGGMENTINPPLFSWVEWENYLLTGDRSRFRDVLPRLVKYYEWLRLNRRRPNGLYWNTGLGAGEDDLVRNDSTYSWVDMTAQQAANAYYIARIAGQIGKRDIERFFESENRALSKLVTTSMWDPKTGFYYDLKRDGTPTGIKTVLGFWPILAHIASRDQTTALIAHLRNPNEFWRTNVVPALSADERGYTPDGQYWNGAVWAPTNFMVVKGLESYGYADLAAKVTSVYLAQMSRVLKESGTIWENYAPDRPAGHGARDMVGWSGDGPIALLIENILGIRGLASEQCVYWRPRLAGRNGIRNLKVGKASVSLVASPLDQGSREITMTSDKPISVVIDTGVGRPIQFRLHSGTTRKTVQAVSAEL
ncbi:MAG: trehalase family glycosidase [Fimbriimonas sp.]|nr:trehalase family glycosidase [Fimbriimonas sp.]